jgi:hypothetical protein
MFSIVENVALHFFFKAEPQIGKTGAVHSISLAAIKAFSQTKLRR